MSLQCHVSSLPFRRITLFAHCHITRDYLHITQHPSSTDAELHQDSRIRSRTSPRIRNDLDARTRQTPKPSRESEIHHHLIQHSTSRGYRRRGNIIITPSDNIPSRHAGNSLILQRRSRSSTPTRQLPSTSRLPQPSDRLPDPNLPNSITLPRTSAVQQHSSVCARPPQRLVVHSLSYEHIWLKPTTRLLPQHNKPLLITPKIRPQSHRPRRHNRNGHRFRPRFRTSLHATHPLPRPPLRRPSQPYDDGLDATDGPIARPPTI